MSIRQLTALLGMAVLTLPLACSSRQNETTQDNPALNYVAEGRGTWIGMSRNARDWDSMMVKLAGAGFNMVFPCMNTGGAAIYPSDVVPMISDGDELAACIEAAHRNGIEVHVWRINWYMSRVPEAFAQMMMDEQRIQYSWDGKRNGEKMKELGYDQNADWLCPSHPENRELEKQAMVELVEKYDVDGVHFDYMRYSNDHMCYCHGCRDRFSEHHGLGNLNWPGDVWEGGHLREVYLGWRRHLIHSLAREIADAVHDLDPYVCVNLAGRNSPSWCTYSDAQEWWKWMDEGILDFLCNMNYTPDSAAFRERMLAHVPLIRDTGVPYYSGLGLYQMDTLAQLKANIGIGRELGQDGWVTFSERALMSHLDEIKKEINTKPALLPHRAPRTRFYLDKPAGYGGQGYAQYDGQTVSGLMSVAMEGKLKEGICAIDGEVWLESTSGERLAKVADIDLETAARVPVSCSPPAPGRYRLGFYGTMTLSTGETRLFAVQSFPFEKAGG